MKKLLLLITFVCLTPCTASTQDNCEPGSSNGEWVLESECSPDAWDDIYVAIRVEGNYMYVVDWCAETCSINCMGQCSAYGTTFPSTDPPCYPESAKVYKWVCIDKEKNLGPGKCQ